MNRAELLDSMAQSRILVVGDVMLDDYIFGRATRVSPEAPVLVLKQERIAAVPGGAANVARNIAAFGAKAHLIGVVGDDDAAARLREGLDYEGLTHSLVTDAERVTTRKTRVIADGRQQMVRIDLEDDAPLKMKARTSLVEHVLAQIETCDALLLSDYTKGCLSTEVVSEIMGAAKSAWKPVIVNAKPSSVASYRSATLISLNRAEASAATGVDVTAQNAAQAAAQLRDQHRADVLVITLGEAGMEVAGPEAFRVAAPRVEVADPAGAGDTVIAGLALGFAAVGFSRGVFELAADAAAQVVQHVGVVAPSADDLNRLRDQVS